MPIAQKISVFLSLSAFILCSYAHGAISHNGMQSCLTGTCPGDTDSNSLLQSKVQVSDLSINQPGDIQGSDPQFIDLDESGLALMAEAFHYWVDDGCSTEGDGSPDDVVGYWEDPSAPAAAARCCSADGTSCSTPEMCPQQLTLAQASSKCAQEGKRLCTKDELLSNMCCGKGGNCDSYKVWTGTSISAPTPAPRPAPTPAPTPALTPAPTPAPTQMQGKGQIKRAWVDDGCESGGNSDDVQGYWEDPKAPAAAARCCSTDGTSCSTPQMCPQQLSFAQASSKCAQEGKRLCTKDEILSGMCCGKGGNCDRYKVWTGPLIEGCPPLEDGSAGASFAGRRRTSAPFTECPVGMTEDSFNAESGCCVPCSGATSQEACNLASCYTHRWGRSRCLVLLCTQPTTAGYDYTGATGIFADSRSFSVTGVTCAPGFTGTAVVRRCDSNGAYKVSGCEQGTSLSQELGSNGNVVEVGSLAEEKKKTEEEQQDDEDEDEEEELLEGEDRLDLEELSEEEEEEEDTIAHNLHKTPKKDGLFTRDYPEFHKEMSVLTVIMDYEDYPAYIRNETRLYDDLWGEGDWGYGGMNSLLDRISNGRLSVSTKSKIVSVNVPKKYASMKECSGKQYVADAKEALVTQHPEVNLNEYTFREYFIPYDKGRYSQCTFAGAASMGCAPPPMIPVNGKREAQPTHECDAIYRTMNGKGQHVRVHELGHLIGLGHAGAEQKVYGMINSHAEESEVAGESEVAPARRRNNPNKRGKNSCRRRDNTEPDSEGWSCSIIGHRWDRFGDWRSSMGMNLRRSEYTASERWVLGFLLSGSHEVVEWYHEADQTFKLQSLERAPGVPGADAVAVRFQCPSCQSYSTPGSNAGGHLWVEFFGDMGDIDAPAGWKVGVENKVTVHYVFPLDYTRRRSAKRVIQSGRGQELWATLEVGQSYSDVPCLQVQFEELVDDLATVSLKSTC